VLVGQFFIFRKLKAHLRPQQHRLNVAAVLF